MVDAYKRPDARTIQKDPNYNYLICKNKKVKDKIRKSILKLTMIKELSSLGAQDS
jgi:hypothetical protein